MAEEIKKVGFGVGTDKVSASNLRFGANFGNVRMTKFEYTDKGGKDGAALEALDIAFSIGGTEKSYRMFPPTAEGKFFKKGQKEPLEKGTEDWKIAFNVAMEDFNNIITHIMKSQVTTEQLEAALTGDIPDFKTYAAKLMKVMPKDFQEVRLDIFLEWQFQITGTNDRTYLQIPNKLKYGHFVCKHVEPAGGEWKENKADGLSYTDSEGNVHPFKRNQWWMESNYANQQKENADEAMGETNQETSTTTEAAESGNDGW